MYQSLHADCVHPKCTCLPVEALLSSLLESERIVLENDLLGAIVVHDQVTKSILFSQSRALR
jgi:hypothetical protein